jgi:hypothetical protein
MKSCADAEAKRTATARSSTAMRGAIASRSGRIGELETWKAE